MEKNAKENALMEIKNKKHVADAMAYFDKLVSEFIGLESEPIIENRGRDIYMTPRAIQRVEVAYQSEPKPYLEKMCRSSLSIAVMEWMKTRKNYDPKAKNPGTKLINWFVWQEVGTVHFYLILQEDALYDVVPADLNRPVIHWAKCAGRFMDATCYPKLKCYFDIKTEENVYFSSDSAVLNSVNERITLLFGDIQDQQNNIEYKVYNGEQDYGNYNNNVTLEDRQVSIAEIVKKQL